MRTRRQIFSSCPPDRAGPDAPAEDWDEGDLSIVGGVGYAGFGFGKPPWGRYSWPFGKAIVAEKGVVLAARGFLGGLSPPILIPYGQITRVDVIDQANRIGTAFRFRSEAKRLDLLTFATLRRDASVLVDALVTRGVHVESVPWWRAFRPS